MLSLPKVSKKGRDSYFTISWVQLKDFVKEALDNRGKIAGISISQNIEKIKDHTVDVRSFHGYTADQLRRWVNDGFQTDILDAISDAAPIREKRRYLYVEEGEELHIDRALSGEDNFMS